MLEPMVALGAPLVKKNLLEPDHVVASVLKESLTCFGRCAHKSRGVWWDFLLEISLTSGFKYRC